MKKKLFFGHPIGLASLFATEMWERFSYYGMRSLLVLFLTAEFINGGFGMKEEEAFTIYGIFTGLVYITPLFGGLIADKILGQRKCIYIGAVTMAIGQFCLAYASYIYSRPDLSRIVFYSGLCILILGEGFFKPNISSMVGKLYRKNDARRDSGFTIFYMGINLGGFLATIIAGELGEKVSWYYGFLSAGIGMVISSVWFYFRSKDLGRIGLPENFKGIRFVTKDRLQILLYIIAISVLSFAIVYGINGIEEKAKTILIIVVCVTGVGWLVRSVVRGVNSKEEWSRVAVILILVIFNIFFFSGYEQAGTTLNVFARDNTQRMLGSFEMPATWFQSFNPVMIVLLAPVFSIMWKKLDKIGWNPNTPMKFAWGLFLLSLGYTIMGVAMDFSANGKLVSPLFLFFLYFFNTCGELCLSPIGLSMVTKLAPEKITSTMMGIWMGSYAFGNIAASQMKMISGKVRALSGLNLNVFWFIVIETFIAFIVLAFLSPWLKKMMKGVK